jgi:hypothetical protein
MQASIQDALQINSKYGEVFEAVGHFCVTQRLYRESVEFSRKRSRSIPDFGRHMPPWEPT